MKRTFKTLIILLAIVLVLPWSACKKKGAAGTGDSSGYSSGSSSGDSSRSGGRSSGETGRKRETRKIDPKPFDRKKIALNPELKPPKAHAKYLDDPMDFFALETLPEGSYAVVGSDLAVFYPGNPLASDPDPNHLKGGKPVPLATLLPLLGKVESGNENAYGMFEYQDNWNWFYKTKWNGTEGIVFGADLAGIDRPTRDVQVMAALYAKDGVFEKFPPFLGFRPLSRLEQEVLTKEKLMVQEVAKSEYHLSAGNPDDMVALYRNESTRYNSDYMRQTPLFITTDFYAHCLHLFFDHTLQYMEEELFIPRLNYLVETYLKELAALEEKAVKDNVGKEERYWITLQRTKAFFLVAECLLAMTPENLGEQSDGEGSGGIAYSEVDTEAIIARYPAHIQEEVRLIMEATKREYSPNFLYSEDYSQFKPRGHYTKNGRLETYFRTMMWFGRLHFYISDDKDSGIFYKPPVADLPQTAYHLSLELAPVALLVNKITADNKGIYEAWMANFDPITKMIGQSDDITFIELLPLWKKQKVKNFREWINTTKNLDEFFAEARQTLRGPRISGNSWLYAPTEGEDKKPPMGWRLFGQRFTHDSHIHQHLSAPRLYVRDIVRGLDIMSVFGSETAYAWLEQLDIATYSPEWQKKTRDKLADLEKFYASQPPEFWGETYYNRVLYMIKSQALFEPGAGFFFTESPAWARKAMTAAHGTWAALRHDTILYVKQVYAERAGDGDFNPTFRTKPLPFPVHYIEPNIEFYKGALGSILDLERIAAEMGADDAAFVTGLETWREILEKSLEIAKTEYEDKPVDLEDLRWISALPDQMVPLVLPFDANPYHSNLTEDDLKGACIADVFTNAELGVVLEVGIGIPYRIYVPLNDAQGGKRVAVGYTFSYYEFLHPMSDRLTDEQWKEMVYKPGADLTDKLPDWAREAPYLPPRE